MRRDVWLFLLVSCADETIVAVPLPPELGDQGSVLILATAGGEPRLAVARDVAQARANSLSVSTEDDLEIEIFAVYSRCPLAKLGIQSGELPLGPRRPRLSAALPVHAQYAASTPGGPLVSVAALPPEGVSVLQHLPVDEETLCRTGSIEALSASATLPIDLSPAFAFALGSAPFGVDRLLVAYESRNAVAGGDRLDHGVFLVDPLESIERVEALQGLTVVGIAAVRDNVLLLDESGTIFEGTLSATTSVWGQIGPTNEARIMTSDGLEAIQMIADQSDAVRWIRARRGEIPETLHAWPPGVLVRGPERLEDGTFAAVAEGTLWIERGEAATAEILPFTGNAYSLRLVPGLGLVLTGASGQIFVRRSDGWEAISIDLTYPQPSVFGLGAGFVSFGSGGGGGGIARRFNRRAGPCGSSVAPLPFYSRLFAISREQIVFAAIGPLESHVNLTTVTPGQLADPCFDP